MAKTRKIQGEVVSAKLTGTVVVKVTVPKTHPKYHKQYLTSKHYQADTAGAEFRSGDLVEIAESRPLSRKKRWRIIRKIR